MSTGKRFQLVQGELSSPPAKLPQMSPEVWQRIVHLRQPLPAGFFTMKFLILLHQLTPDAVPDIEVECRELAACLPGKSPNKTRTPAAEEMEGSRRRIQAGRGSGNRGQQNDPAMEAPPF